MGKKQLKLVPTTHCHPGPYILSNSYRENKKEINKVNENNEGNIR